jgi:hypothetical protein
MQAWAFFANVNDREWTLAGCFGIATLGMAAQILALVLIRRENRHSK